MFILKDNGDGTFLGADEEGTVYDGTLVEISYSDLTVETTETEAGYERVTKYLDEVISKGNIDKESWKQSYAALRTDSPTEEQVEEAWQAELGITQHKDIFVLAYVDGEETMVEKKLKRIDWVAR